MSYLDKLTFSPEVEVSGSGPTWTGKLVEVYVGHLIYNVVLSACLLKTGTEKNKKD